MLISLVLGAGDNPLGHVLDRPLIGDWFSMNTLTMLLVVGLMLFVFVRVAEKIGTGPESEGNERYVTKGRLAQLLEVIILYLRDTVIRPQLGHNADKFTPFLLTLFFFVLFNNMIGLIPLLDVQHLFGALFLDNAHFAVIGGTPTGRLAVTLALASVAFILWHINGLRENGIKGWAAHFLGGAPWYLAPIMLPVEIMGTFVKPFALALRLFANMTAGHVLLAVIIGFVASSLDGLGWVLGSPIALISIIAGIAIMFLETFVAFLQAFIFMFLTTLFIAQMSHHHHDEEHGAEAYDEEHSMEDDATVPVSVV